jgi:hypothetical protein
MWDGLAEEIADLFGDHDGADRYDRRIEEYVAWSRARAVELTRLWRLRHPARAKANQRAWSKGGAKRWLAVRPEKRRLYAKRYRDKNRDKVREWNRENQKKRRARLRQVAV